MSFYNLKTYIFILFKESFNCLKKIYPTVQLKYTNTVFFYKINCSIRIHSQISLFIIKWTLIDSTLKISQTNFGFFKNKQKKYFMGDDNNCTVV